MPYEETRRTLSVAAVALGLAIAALAVAAMVACPAPARAAQGDVCCYHGARLWTCGADAGCAGLTGSCADQGGTIVPAASCTAGATPTPTPTSTPTPTPSPVAFTVRPFLRAADLGYTYVQALTMVDGVVWGNGGVCCPSIGEGIGECLFSIDYNVTPPRAREWWCTYRDTTQLWETGLPQVAHSDLYRWVVVGTTSRRPAAFALQDQPRDSHLFGFGVGDLAARWFSAPQSVGQDGVRVPGGYFWPQGLLDLGGSRYLYLQVFDWQTGNASLWRFLFDNPYSVGVWPEGGARLTAGDLPMFSGLAIDADGSLVTSTGWWPSQNNVKVEFWRSADQGRAWAKTGRYVEAPAGSTLFGCGWAHASGGAALQPWLLLCTCGTGLGPDQVPGDWNGCTVAAASATLPTGFGTKPVFER